MGVAHADATAIEPGLHHAWREKRKMLQVRNRRQLDLLSGDGRADYSVPVVDDVIRAVDKAEASGRTLPNDIRRVIDGLVARNCPIAAVYRDIEMFLESVVAGDNKFSRVQTLVGRNKVRALQKAKARFRPK